MYKINSSTFWERIQNWKYLISKVPRYWMAGKCKGMNKKKVFKQSAVFRQISHMGLKQIRCLWDWVMVARYSFWTFTKTCWWYYLSQCSSTIGRIYNMWTSLIFIPNESAKKQSALQYYRSSAQFDKDKNNAKFLFVTFVWNNDLMGIMVFMLYPCNIKLLFQLTLLTSFQSIKSSSTMVSKVPIVITYIYINGIAEYRTTKLWAL